MYRDTKVRLNCAHHKSLPSVCVYVYVALLSLLGKGTVKCIPHFGVGNSSVQTLPRHRIYTRRFENYRIRHFLSGQYSIKGKEAISSSQYFLLISYFTAFRSLRMKVQRAVI